MHLGDHRGFVICAGAGDRKFSSSTRTSQSGIFQRMVPSKRRFPCLDGTFPVNCLRKSSENSYVECGFHCKIQFSSGNYA